MIYPFRYERLAYVALNVTDLEKSVAYYNDLIGLDISDDSHKDQTTLRCSKYATDLALYRNNSAGLRQLGFQLESKHELGLAEQHFLERGYEILSINSSERDLLQIGNAFRIFEPETGITFDFFVHMIEPATPFKKKIAKIQRLGHAVIRTVNFDECWSVLEKDFAMLASDFVDNKGVWMRCHPNPFHHSLAIIKTEKPGFHHVNFMVSEIDDIGQAQNRLKKSDVKIVYGPGRHMPSGSMFYYFHDPDKLTVEYSFGMEEFPEENPRKPRMLKNSPDVMDLWGGLPDPEFCAFGEISKPGNQSIEKKVK